MCSTWTKSWWIWNRWGCDQGRWVVGVVLDSVEGYGCAFRWEKMNIEVPWYIPIYWWPMHWKLRCRHQEEDTVRYFQWIIHLLIYPRGEEYRTPIRIVDMISKWRLVNTIDSIQIPLHPCDISSLVITRDNVRTASIEGDILTVYCHSFSKQSYPDSCMSSV